MSSTAVCFMYLVAATVACLEFFIFWEKNKKPGSGWVIKSSFCALLSFNCGESPVLQADFNVFEEGERFMKCRWDDTGEFFHRQQSHPERQDDPSVSGTLAARPGPPSLLSGLWSGLQRWQPWVWVQRLSAGAVYVERLKGLYRSTSAHAFCMRKTLSKRRLRLKKKPSGGRVLENMLNSVKNLNVEVLCM